MALKLHRLGPGLRDLLSVYRHLHGVDVPAPLALPGREAADHLGGGGGLRVLEKPILVHRRPTGQSLEVIVEPNLIAENWIIEVEVVSCEAAAGDEDDSTSLADLGWSDGVNSSSSGAA